MGFISKALWETLNEHFDDDVEFATSFVRRQASEKHYYDLRTKDYEVWISVRYSSSKSKLSAAIYTFDKKWIYNRLLENKDIIEETIGQSLDYRLSSVGGREGRSQNVLIHCPFVDSSGDERHRVELVKWIQETALLLKSVEEKWGLGRDVNIYKSATKKVADINVPIKITCNEEDTKVTCPNCSFVFDKASRCPECGQLVELVEE